MPLCLFPVFSYQSRDVSSIQDDLNKLYDTRPTSPTVPKHSRTRHSRKGGGGSKASQPNSLLGSAEGEPGAVPQFDLNNSGNVTAVLGKTAILNCRVKNIGNKTVSKSFKKYFLRKKYLFIHRKTIR